MRGLRIAYLGIGILLLAGILAEVDLGEAASRLASIGWGFAAVMAVYALSFVLDSAIWLLALPRLPLDLSWTARMFLVRTAGDAFNYVVPAGGFGGEPVKADILKRRYGIGVRETTASIVLARTLNMLAMLPFLAVGLVFMADMPAVPGPAQAAAVAGFALLTFGTLLLFAVQRGRGSSWAGARLARLPWLSAIARILHHVRDMEDRLIEFYAERRGRFLWATALGFVAWLIGAVEVYVALAFMGAPVTWLEAWTIEAVAQMVRSATFFIPASLGAQEGAFVVVSGAITGSPATGAALALVRRARELVWIGLGMAIAAGYAAAPGGNPPSAGREAGPPSR